MRRRGRHEHKRGLAEERRQLVHRYMSAASPAAAEPEPDPDPDPEPIASQPDDAPATSPVPQPRLVEPESPSPVTLPSRADRPLVLEPLRPGAFDGANRMLEEVVRLCEQIARLRAECDRQREPAADAGP